MEKRKGQVTTATRFSPGENHFAKIKKAMKFLMLITITVSLSMLVSCVGSMNPTGGNSTPNYPYYITVKPLVVKKILVPAGTKLIYEEQFLKEGAQDKMLSEERLKDIELPIDKTINWGGVPVTSIYKFFNSEMSGFTVTADFNKLSDDKKTKFSDLWNRCSNDLGVMVKDINDWSFNKQNIVDIESCSVNYQRYFKENTEQQLFLDSMYSELMKIGSK